MQFLELRDLLLELEFLSKVWLWTQVILAFEKVADNFSVSKNSPLGPQKIKNDLKIKWKSKVRIEGNIENKSCSTPCVDPKPVFDLYSNPKNSPLGP